MRENRPLILLLDDDPHDRALARLVLEREVRDVRIEEIADAPAFAQACGRRSFALVILETRLDWADGLAVLSVLREDWPGIPVILFTRHGSEEISVRALRLGASDYLVKSSQGFLRLPMVVQSALDRARSPSGAVPLQSLVDQARVAVFSATPDGRLLNASPGFLKLLGAVSLDEAARLDLRPLALALAGPLAVDAHAAREVRLRRLDGSPLWVEAVGAVSKGPEGERVDGLIEDVTARKTADEETARRSDQLRTLNEELQRFTAIASHELKEPVRMMERHAELLKEELGGQLDAAGIELVDTVADSARRLRKLIDDLLAFSRTEGRPLRTERVSADALLDSALADLEAVVEESGARVERSPLPVIEADTFQITQVFRNLLSNSLKFRGPEPPNVRVSVSRGARDWIFTVRDNGTGIDPADAETIFGMFTRLRPEVPGSGIGLALCRRIVERHGGRIWVDSAPGRGSAFCFTLPATGGSEA